MAVSTIVLATAWACGGDGGNVEPNTPPVAAFTAPTTCTVNAPCAFTDASTDDHGIASREWDFGDGSAKVTDASTTHAFAEAKDYTVTLTVTDAAGETSSVSHAVTVGAGTPSNLPPVASFTVPPCVINTACTFTSTSTDADGQVAAARWDFSDDQSSLDGPSVDHTFATEGAFNVTLTVTDDDGATNAITQSVTVSPAASQDCVSNGTTEVICTIAVAQRSTLAITLTGVSCEIGGNRLFIPPPEPRAQTVFTNVCSQIVPAEYGLTDPSGAPLILEAGTQLPIQFHRGTPDAGDPAAGPPAAKLESTSANNWTISIDDGGNVGGPSEPDFTDALLTVVATPVP
jgi:PKD repeat protein